MPGDRPSEPSEQPEQRRPMRELWESDRPREQMTPEQLGARIEGWKRADQERAAAKETAEQRRVETYRESLGGEPPKLGEGGLLDARMRIEDRTAEGDFRKITRGVWYSSEPGWGHIESGAREKGQPDELAVKARELIEERTPFEKLSIAGDVEMKLAARMVRDEIPLMTVVINRQVCTGDRSCDSLLREVLPAGYKLRVYEDGGQTMKLYEGKWEGTG